MFHEFSMMVRVTDPTTLIKAAAKKMVADGAFETVEEYIAEHGEDTASAIRWLCDPGTLPGCEIEDSTCE